MAGESIARKCSASPISASGLIAEQELAFKEKRPCSHYKKGSDGAAFSLSQFKHQQQAKYPLKPDANSLWHHQTTYGCYRGKREGFPPPHSQMPRTV